MFQFKQCTIHQERCAMKITEVACILGAWVPIPSTARSVLDIGSGTGLLSLMLAQRFPQIRVDAVEIDEAAFLQGKENIQASPFAERIQCFHADIRLFESKNLYDFVICNPPFFEGQLKSSNAQKNTAWHSEQLGLKELIATMKQKLTPSGQSAVLFPSSRRKELEDVLAQYNFHPQQLALLHHSAQHESNYLMLMFGASGELQTEALYIREGTQYTSRIKELLKAFYLKL